MNKLYSDILALTDKEPAWFDEQAVPRFCEFYPNEVSNIYADEVALLLIACQCCGHLFKVAMSHNNTCSSPSILMLIENNSLEYGDPPNIDCCCGGPSTTSETVQILEMWVKVHNPYSWHRKPQYEGEPSSVSRSFLE